jgi:hypothetical protein
VPTQALSCGVGDAQREAKGGRVGSYGTGIILLDQLILPTIQMVSVSGIYLRKWAVMMTRTYCPFLLGVFYGLILYFLLDLAADFYL